MDLIICYWPDSLLMGTTKKTSKTQISVYCFFECSSIFILFISYSFVYLFLTVAAVLSTFPQCRINKVYLIISYFSLLYQSFVVYTRCNTDFRWKYSIINSTTFIWRHKIRWLYESSLNYPTVVKSRWTWITNNIKILPTVSITWHFEMQCSIGWL